MKLPTWQSVASAVGHVITAVVVATVMVAWQGCHHPLPPGPPAPPPLPLSIPAEVQAAPGRLVEIDATTKAKRVWWECREWPASAVGPDGKPQVDLHLHDNGLQVWFVAPIPGRYTLRAQTVIAEEIISAAPCVVTVGDVPPGPAPIPEPGLRVLVVYDTATPLPRAQLDILSGQTVRTWLNAHCVKGADGKTAEWRFWDTSIDAAGESAIWQKAMQRKRDKLPWVVISTGKAGIEGPLPDDVSKMMDLLGKYGN